MELNRKAVNSNRDGGRETPGSKKSRIGGGSDYATKKERMKELENVTRSSLQKGILEGKFVFGRGNPEEASVMFIGEAPGAQEAAIGSCFVGPAGKKLDSLLSEIDIPNDGKHAYFANILKYRPPQNRDPSKEEITQHAPFLLEQIAIISPRCIVALGNFASKYLLGGCDPSQMSKVPGVTSTNGKFYDVRFSFFKRKIPVLVAFHPSAILRNPSLENQFRDSFAVLRRFLDVSKKGEKDSRSVIPRYPPPIVVAKSSAGPVKSGMKQRSISDFFKK